MSTPAPQSFDAPDLLLVGPVRHKRLRPARNAFSYGVYTLRLPLRARAARLAQGTQRDSRLFATNRFGLLSFHDSDHGAEGQTALQWIESMLHENGIHDATGEIFLHTFPRVLGYVFNPVSFWFCERADGTLRAVVCEVNNTFGERHCYLLDPGSGVLNGTPLTARKVFHVSPFCKVQGHYTFRFMFASPKRGKPLRSLARIDYDDGEGPLLLTSIAGSARPLDTRNVLRVFFGYPLMTFGVAKIHWQALKLFFKRVPFLSKTHSAVRERLARAGRIADQVTCKCRHSPPPLHRFAVRLHLGSCGPGCWTHGALRKPAAARVVLRLLSQLQYGVLDVHLPDGTTRRFGQAPDAAGNPPYARVVLTNWNVCAAALKSGDIGFAETYLAGDWHTDDLAALLDIMVRNRTTIEAVVYGSWFGKLTNRFRHLRNANTKEGSRRNIHAHYDLGNAFYKLWLDSTMTYSSALFDGSPDQTLDDAQRAKYRRLLKELELEGVNPSVLEIGCGWGGFAQLAASEAKASVTGLTLSTEQLAYAQQRLADAGLSDRTDLRLQDYRDTHGQFDAIASIEMFEAVGEEYWPSYFECIKRNLKRGGRACVQTITIDNALFDRYRTSTDFIQQYIFPGGMLPSPAVFVQSAERHGLKVVNQFSFGRDYARTLRMWRNAFVARLDEIRAQRFDERFIRLWDFYLCYCEAAFAHSNTDVIQFTLEHA